MEKIEMIRYILLNTKVSNLKHETDILLKNIEEFSIKNPQLFNETIDKKLEQVTSSALLKVNKGYTTESLMIDGFILFIKQFDEMYL